ncbi:MAG: T9SS type A sorting domain-containing protein [Taibaiella sp.]|nr:T9SS type A sorting domain-containing protein [Taibaiella sp.]
MMIRRSWLREVSMCAEVKVYPDPSSGKVTIEWDLQSGNHPHELFLYDFLGKTMFHQSLAGANGNCYIMDVQPLPSGVYLVLPENEEREYGTSLWVPWSEGAFE